MTLKFIPPKASGRYALFVDGSRHSFKVYNDLGYAKNAWHAIGSYYAAKILENVDGEWYVLFDLPKGIIDVPWQKEASTRSWRSSSYHYKRAVPMTRDEYAEWRVKVERERKTDLSSKASLNNN